MTKPDQRVMTAEVWLILIFGFGFLLVSLIPGSQVIVGLFGNGPFDPTNLAIITVVWLLFAFIGGLAVAGGLWMIRDAKRVMANQRAHPDQPWRWSPEWQGNSIADHPWHRAAASGVMALIAGGVVGTCTVAFASNPGPADSWFLWAILIMFNFLVLGLACRALHQATVAWKWGTSRLHLATIPVVPGRSLVGSVTAPARLPMEKPILVRLTCEQIRRHRNRVMGREVGDVQHYHVPLWQTTRLILAPASLGNPGETVLPIEIKIPLDAPETNDDESRSWTLHLDSQMAWFGYEAEFDVPVFRTSQEQALAPEQSMGGTIVDEPIESLLSRAGVMRIEKASGVEFVITRSLVSDHKIHGLFIWIGWMIISAVMAVSPEVPWYFRVAFPTLGVLVGLAGIAGWSRQTTVAVDASGITWAKSIAGFTRRANLSADSSVTVEADFISPSSTTAPQSCLVIRSDQPKTPKLVLPLPEHAAAQAIADQLV